MRNFYNILKSKFLVNFLQYAAIFLSVISDSLQYVSLIRSQLNRRIVILKLIVENHLVCDTFLFAMFTCLHLLKFFSSCPFHLTCRCGL